MVLTAVLIPAEKGGDVALSPETGTTTQGETVEEAVASRKEANSLYVSEFPRPSLGHPVAASITVRELLNAKAAPLFRRRTSERSNVSASRKCGRTAAMSS